MEKRVWARCKLEELSIQQSKRCNFSISGEQRLLDFLEDGEHGTISLAAPPVFFPRLLGRGGLSPARGPVLDFVVYYIYARVVTTAEVAVHQQQLASHIAFQLNSIASSRQLPSFQLFLFFGKKVGFQTPRPPSGKEHGALSFCSQIAHGLVASCCRFGLVCLSC